MAFVRGIGLYDLDDSEAGIAKFLARNPGTCFVAESGGEIVGSILAGNDGRRGYIYHTAVSGRLRGRGIGGILVERALSALESCGINKVALVVYEGNSGGNKFWEKCGFNLRTDIVYRDKTLKNMVRVRG